MVRTKDSGGSNASFELISQRLAGVENKVVSIGTLMNTMMPGDMTTKASPSLPFKIEEEKRNDGIYINVQINVPSNCGRVRVYLINKFQNTAQSGETEAQSKARAKAHLQVFTIKVTDAERMARISTTFIGPFQPKDNLEKNKYQLILLEAKSKADMVFVPNPMTDPTNTFPFQVFCMVPVLRRVLQMM